MPLLNVNENIRVGVATPVVIERGEVVWPEDIYLNPQIGTVTTPNPGELPPAFTIISKLRGPTGGNLSDTQSWANQYPSSWSLARRASDAFLFMYSNPGGTRATQGPPVTGGDEHIAVSFEPGAGRMTTWNSPDGVTWTQVATRVEGAFMLATPTEPVRIGSTYVTNFTGRVYSVECRRGMNPSVVDSPYILPTVGTITTPDPGPFPNEFVHVYKVRGPSNSWGAIAAQLETTNQFSWVLAKRAADRAFSIYPNGNNTGASTSVLNAPGPTGSDEYEAMAYTLDNGAGRQIAQRWTSPDGVTWTPGTPTNVLATLIPFDTTTIMRIGMPSADPSTIFNGRIYWTELRTGLDPRAGTVLWRFDATEIPTPPAPTYTSPLDIDSNADGVADGWVAYIAGGVDAASRSVTNGAQRIVGAPQAGAAYGVDVSPRPTIQPNTKYALTVHYTGTATLAAMFQLYGICYTAGGVTTGSAFGAVPPNSATRTTVTYYFTSPADAATVRILPRLLPTGAPNPAQPMTVDIHEITLTAEMTYTDPRGRAWTVPNTTTLQPADGTTVWRFDVADYPGTGMSYVDPRGRTWTLTTPRCIVID